MNQEGNLVIARELLTEKVARAVMAIADSKIVETGMLARKKVVVKLLKAMTTAKE